MTDDSQAACELCDGTGLVEDPTACGDPDHCPGWMPCPNGCPEADSELAEGELRARVIEVLEAAGFRNREDHLPTRKAGGTFSAIGSNRSGVNVTADWWDATLPELEELRRGLARALHEAGFTVLQMGPERSYVPPAPD